MPEPKPRLILEVHSPEGISKEYTIGPHTPRLRAEDLELMHKVWLDVTSDPRYCGAHHYHVVKLALEELERELSTEKRTELLAKLFDEMRDDAKPC